MVNLVGEIGELGGVAIPAHIDANDGILGAMSTRAMADLLSSPGLAALEFTDRAALEGWFTTRDPAPRASCASSRRPRSAVR